MLENVSLVLINKESGERCFYRSPSNTFYNLVPGEYALTANILDIGGHHYSVLKMVNIGSREERIDIIVPGYTAHDPLRIEYPQKFADNPGSIELKAFFVDVNALPERLIWVEAGPKIHLESNSAVLLMAVDENGTPIKGANITSTGNGQYRSNSTSNIMAIYYDGGLSRDIFKAEFNGTYSNDVEISLDTAQNLVISDLSVSDDFPVQFENFDITCTIRNIGTGELSDLRALPAIRVYPECEMKDSIIKQPDTIIVHTNQLKQYKATIYCKEPGEHFAFIGNNMIKFNVYPSENPVLTFAIRGNRIDLKAGQSEEMTLRDEKGLPVSDANVYIGSMPVGKTDEGGKITLMFRDENPGPGYLVNAFKKGYSSPEPVIVYVSGEGDKSVLADDSIQIYRNTATVPSDSRRIIDLVFYWTSRDVMACGIIIHNLLFSAIEYWFVTLILAVFFILIIVGWLKNRSVID
ncbi:hypothetical protein CUJ83_12045 [Methanocella sp. CWC-04]|uniref:Uncharacterized protein n=2 Tax=Methanooceanicella nereidis TaxID=2052831 RepID=A0AAP2RFP3_9EURY|nr:hypothetical protein [Methanocella sp. CWC-04]